MSRVIELRAFQEKRSRTLQMVREVASKALWVDPSRLTVRGLGQGSQALLDGRPLTREESEVINRYVDSQVEGSRARTS